MAHGLIVLLGDKDQTLKFKDLYKTIMILSLIHGEQS